MTIANRTDPDATEKTTVPVITRYVVVEFTGEQPWVDRWTDLLKGEVQTTDELMDALYENAHNGTRRDPKTQIVRDYDRRQD
jgi:hypothetical protein